ncbi:MAG: hypothetical protein ACE5I3_12160 [Phycisphaerae bacterium]
MYRWELMLAGAPLVVDEEEQVRLRMASAVRKMLRAARCECRSGNDTT